MKPSNFTESEKRNDFYNNYFSSADYNVFRYDVGSFCTRKLILSQIKHKYGTLLEIGTGISSMLSDIKNSKKLNFDCFGVDISDTTISTVKKQFDTLGIKAELKVANAENLPFPDNTFDVIISAHTLEHIKNDNLVIKECARTLKPGGELIIFVPGRKNGIATQEEFSKFGHFRYYNKSRFQALEQTISHNLKITKLIYPHKIHNLIWNRLKNLFRWSNYPIKKWILKDNKTYEVRPIYQKFFLPAVSKTLDLLDKTTMHTEKNFLGVEFNVLVKFEKI
ncbi:MAG: class I SAM-dependent methyltransferase [bacterium]